MSQEIKDVMDKLFRLIPKRFFMVQGKIPVAQHMILLNKSSPLLIIKPQLQGSWLDPPKDLNADIVWPGNIAFPKGTNPYVKDFVNRPPARPFDTLLVNPRLRKLLLASKIKFANLNTPVFKINFPIKLSGMRFVKIDYFLRNCLYDTFFSEDLLGCAFEIAIMLRAQLETDHPGIDKEYLDFLLKLLGLLSLSNQRSVHGQIAAFVANKYGLRKYVLNKLQVPATTARVLRGTDFATEGVFGEIPRGSLDFHDSLRVNS